MTYENIIEAKKESRYNFSWWLAPIIGFALLLISQTIGLLWAEITRLLTGIESQILELFSFAFIASAILLWTRLVEKSPWAGLGIFRKNFWKQFSLGWFLGAGLLLSCVLLMMVLGAVKITSVNFSPSLVGRFLVLILAWSVQSTTEELLCRGWLFTSLSTRYPIYWSIFVSAFFFTIIHIGNDGLSLIPLLDLFSFGVLAALCFLKFNNLWVISGIHAAWNCFQGSVFAFPVSGNSTGAAFVNVSLHGKNWLSGGPFGVEGSLISVLVQLIFISWLVFDLFYKKQGETKLHLLNSKS
ncbi:MULTISPECIES: CPBP family intramembrane glutamic endopeptidase [Streptococcus]|uniref:CPBP family intramembrane glutamic endopeptidase n=1 Tax=Streptococcus caledonicus TaxID=2614158 RepID=A0ABW0UCW0_9STRE|nr:type II CAAX endopeptidase family protein [Streptococcus sp. S784/96/1]